MKTALDYYSTSDLNLTVVISLFYPIDSLDKKTSQRIIFNFKREPGLDDLITNYWAHRLRVEPQALLNQLKAIKTRIYEM